MIILVQILKKPKDEYFKYIMLFLLILWTIIVILFIRCMYTKYIQSNMAHSQCHQIKSSFGNSDYRRTLQHFNRNKEICRVLLAYIRKSYNSNLKVNRKLDQKIRTAFLSFFDLFYQTHTSIGRGLEKLNYDQESLELYEQELMNISLVCFVISEKTLKMEFLEHSRDIFMKFLSSSIKAVYEFRTVKVRKFISETTLRHAIDSYCDAAFTIKQRLESFNGVFEHVSALELELIDCIDILADNLCIISPCAEKIYEICNVKGENFQSIHETIPQFSAHPRREIII